MNNNIEILPKKEYQWNEHWANPIAHTDINIVVQELKDIQEVRGKVTAELILESAKNKKSVLHNYFQWDDAKAAHSYRLGQATQLLSRIEVKIIKDGQPRVLRAFEITLQPKFGKMDVEYSSFDTTTTTKFIKSVCISDLNRVKKRLIGHELAKAVEYIDKAIEELQKEPEIISIEPPQAIHLNGLQKLLADKVR
jgi:hypothetical protein